MFLKASNYLKTCPTRFPGAQSTSLHPELPQELLKVDSYSNMGFTVHEADGKCLSCSVIGNSLDKYQCVVDKNFQRKSLGIPSESHSVVSPLCDPMD